MSEPKLVLGSSKKSRLLPADPILLHNLVAMGFGEKLCKVALGRTHNKGITDALDWIDQNKDFKPDEEEMNKTAETSTINKADPFQKASKRTPHPDEVFVPAGKLKGFTHEEKETFRKKQIEEGVKERAKERKEKRRQLKLLRKQMKRERKEKERKKKELEEKEGKGSPKKAPTTTAKPVVEAGGAKPCVVQVRLPKGRPVRYEGISTDPLKYIYEFVMEQAKLNAGSFCLLTTYPKREYYENECETITISDAELSPRGVLTVQLLEGRGIVKKGEEPYPVPDGGRGFPMPGGRGHPPMPMPIGGGGRGLPPFPMPGPPGPMPGRGGGMPLGGGGVPLGGGPKKSDSDDEEEIDEFRKLDPDLGGMAKLLERQWFLNEEETPDDGSGVEIFRVSNDSGAFVRNLSFLHTRMFTSSELESETVTGKWKLKRDEEKKLKIVMYSKNGKEIVEVVTLTSQILIIRRKK